MENGIFNMSREGERQRVDLGGILIKKWIV